MKHRLQALIVSLAALVVASQAKDVRACVTCATGDPSLAAMGNDAWSRNSWRLQTSLRLRSFGVGDAEIDERRLGLAVQYAPTSRFSILGRQFVAHQSLSLRNLSEERRYVFSDPWIGSRLVLFRDGSFAPRHQLTLDGGITLPVVGAALSEVGPVGRDAELTGERAEVNLGLAYRYRRSAAALLLHASVRSGDDPAFLAQARLAYQPANAISFVLGATVQQVLRAPTDHVMALSFGFRARVGVSTFGVELAVPIHVAVEDGDAGPILLLDWIVDA